MDDDDARLWAMVTRSVEPLKSTEMRIRDEARRAAKEAPQPEPARKPAQRKPRQVVRRASPSPEMMPVRAVREDRRGRVAGLDRRTAERLRKGQYPVEARLDLHGMNQEQAHQALRLFVRQCHAARKRCLLVITGKGSRQRDLDQGPYVNAEPPGILKRNVPVWLNERDMKTFILAVTSAAVPHGGAGAVYVLLKRQREA